MCQINIRYSAVDRGGQRYFYTQFLEVVLLIAVSVSTNGITVDDHAGSGLLYRSGQQRSEIVQ